MCNQSALRCQTDGREKKPEINYRVWFGREREESVQDVEQVSEGVKSLVEQHPAVKDHLFYHNRFQQDDDGDVSYNKDTVVITRTDGN